MRQHCKALSIEIRHDKVNPVGLSWPMNGYFAIGERWCRHAKDSIQIAKDSVFTEFEGGCQVIAQQRIRARCTCADMHSRVFKHYRVQPLPKAHKERGWVWFSECNVTIILAARFDSSVWQRHLMDRRNFSSIVSVTGSVIRRLGRLTMIMIWTVQWR